MPAVETTASHQTTENVLAPVLLRPQPHRYHSTPGFRTNAADPDEGLILHAPKNSNARGSLAALPSAGLALSVDQAYGMHLLEADKLSTGALSMRSPSERRTGSGSLHSTLFSPLRSHSGMSSDDFLMGMAWSPGLGHGLSWGPVPSPRYRGLGGSFDFAAMTPMQKDFPRSAGSTDVAMAPITPTIASVSAASQAAKSKDHAPTHTQIASTIQQPKSNMLSPPSTGTNVGSGNLMIHIPSPRLFASPRFSSGAADTISPPSPSSANESFKQGWFKRDEKHKAPKLSLLGQSSLSEQVQMRQDTSSASTSAQNRGHAHTLSSNSTVSGTETCADSFQEDDMMGKVIIIGPASSTAANVVDGMAPFDDVSSSEESMTEDEFQNDSETEPNSAHDNPSSLTPLIKHNRLQSLQEHDPHCSPSRFLQLTLDDPGLDTSTAREAGAAGSQPVLITSIGPMVPALPFPAAGAQKAAPAEDDDDEDGDDEDGEEEEDEDADGDEEDYEEDEDIPAPSNKNSAVQSHHFSMFGGPQPLSLSMLGSHQAPRMTTHMTTQSVSSVGSATAAMHDVQGGAKRRSRPTATAARNRSSSLLSATGVGSSNRTPGVSDKRSCSDMISNILGDQDGHVTSRSRTSSIRSNLSTQTTASDASLALAFGAMGGAFEPIEYHGVEAGLEPLEKLAQRCRQTQSNKAKAPIMEQFAAEWMDHFYEEDEQGTVNRAYMNQSYRAVCRTYRMHPLNPSAFGRLVRTQFPNINTRRLGPRGNSRYHYTGLAVKLNGRDGERAPAPAPAGPSSLGISLAAKSSSGALGATVKPMLGSSPASKVSSGTIRPNMSTGRKGDAPMVPSSSRLTLTATRTPDASPWIGTRPELRRTFSDTYSSASGTNPFFYVPPVTASDENTTENIGWGMMPAQNILGMHQGGVHTDTSAAAFPFVFFDSPATSSGSELPAFDTGAFAFPNASGAGIQASPDMASLSALQESFASFVTQQQQQQQAQEQLQQHANLGQISTGLAQSLAYLNNQATAPESSANQGLGLFYASTLPQTTLSSLHPPVPAPDSVSSSEASIPAPPPSWSSFSGGHFSAPDVTSHPTGSGC
ncbi:hypothetical protein OC834_004367 [Tilletia horrida]|nr:hypothetical protein OC834_004367 [Tilletia horrida]